jgi:hypothetical protein
MKTRFLLISLILVAPVFAQRNKKNEKPPVHSDFYFGSYPLSRTAMQMMADEQTRETVVAYAEDWSLEKLAKNLKLNISDLNRISDKLEDERLVRRDEYNEFRPGMPVIRDRDLDRAKEGLQKQAQELSDVLQNHWTDIEKMVDSLQGSKEQPKGRVLYETVVSGILLGGMPDAFYDDKTLMPPPPRRGKTGNDRYYAWLVESNADFAGKLKRDLRESDGYRIISIGSQLPEERQEASDLRGKATVYDNDDAAKYRRFVAVFSRDTLLPYIKNRRQQLLAMANLMSSGHYVAFAEVFAWYYNTMVDLTVDNLVAAHRIVPPEKYYTYAVKIPQ